MMPTDPQASSPATAVVVSSTATAGQMLATPKGIPDIVIKVVTPLFAIFVRAMKAFIDASLASLTATGFAAYTGAVPIHDAVSALKVAAAVGAFSALISALRNAATLFTYLGDKYPILKT